MKENENEKVILDIKIFFVSELELKIPKQVFQLRKIAVNWKIVS